MTRISANLNNDQFYVIFGASVHAHQVGRTISWKALVDYAGCAVHLSTIKLGERNDAEDFVKFNCPD